VNKAIHILRLMTTAYEVEDDKRFFVEPIDMLENLTLIYHRLLNDFDDELEPRTTQTEPRVTRSQLSQLEHQSSNYFKDHLKKMLNAHRYRADFLCELVERLIYEKELHEYTDWVDLQD